MERMTTADVISQLADHIERRNIDNAPVEDLLWALLERAAEEGRRRAVEELSPSL